MDFSRLSIGGMIAGGSGLLLLLFMFTGWFTVDLVTIEVGDGRSFTGGGRTFDGWASFGFPLDVLLLAIALLAMALSLLEGAELDGPPTVAVTACGALAVVLIVARLVDAPGDGAERGIGVVFSLIAALGISVGGYLASEERG